MNRQVERIRMRAPRALAANVAVSRSATVHASTGGCFAVDRGPAVGQPNAAGLGLRCAALRDTQRWFGNRAAQRVVQRQAADDAAASGASGAAVAAVPAGCPADFCTPFSSRLEAQAVRAAMAPVLLAGIAAKVQPAVVPLWHQYLFGGTAPQNLSAQFGADFSASATTAATTDTLVEALRQDIEAHPPAVAAGATVTVDVPSRIPTQIAAIGNPASADVMDFNVIGEVPGNIAGGVGTDQLSTPVGALPSPFNDARSAAGSADVTGNADGSMTVVPHLQFTVSDTIDLCPGNCGTSLEQIATVPMSRMEASGIAGDVPFMVQFDAPARSFIARPSVPVPPVPVPPTPTPVAPVQGRVTASALRIRASPSTSAPVAGLYPRDTIVMIDCVAVGSVVEGDSRWARTDRGFVSHRFLQLLGPTAPAGC